MEQLWKSDFSDKLNKFCSANLFLIIILTEIAATTKATTDVPWNLLSLTNFTFQINTALNVFLIVYCIYYL